jgi:hypothetical protein
MKYFLSNTKIRYMLLLNKSFMNILNTNTKVKLKPQPNRQLRSLIRKNHKLIAR